MGSNLDRVLELTLLLGRDARRGPGPDGPDRVAGASVWELQRRGPCTQRALADALKVAPRTITTLIDALVETGFVTREPHPSDRRATLVTFTAHGQETARALVEGHVGSRENCLRIYPPECSTASMSASPTSSPAFAS